MKKSFTKNSLAAILLILVIAISCVGCFGDPTVTPNTDVVDKAAIEAEIALAITEQGDYTSASYSDYVAKLTEAKLVLNDEEATQDSVDAALAALTEARLALAVRPVEEVEGGNKEFRLISGDSKEISLADYVNVNGLSKITYDVKVSNAVLSKTAIADGKFTVTAGDVIDETDVKVSIIVYYDNVQKLVVELTVKITNDLAPALVKDAVVKEYDMFDLANKESLVLNFAENIDNSGNLELQYSVKCDGEALSLDGTCYTITLGSYTETTVYKTFTVTVSFTANGEAKTIEYTYKLGLKDTSAYRVPNGNFENGLDGWTLTNTQGEAPFAGIDEKNKFWAEEFPMFNVGKYFSSYADGAEEPSQGRLASPYFVARGEYLTYMLGGAGNHNVYITIENKSGEVLALYRNTKFADLPKGEFSVEEKREMIGNTVFLANFVTYKVNIAGFAGQEIRVVIHDYASAGWGVVFFDELNTYYATVDAVPENATLAENLLANKDNLNAEIALEVAEQGDYTLDSFNAYLEKLAEAKALVADIAVTQEIVDEVTAALKSARETLAIRPVEEVAGANKAFNLVSGNGKEVSISDFVNANGLSNITFAVESDNALVTLGEIADGKFTVTAGEVSEITTAKVSIIAYYKGEEKLVVELTVTVTNDVAPTLFAEEIVKNYDIFALENKTNITLDFAENVDNAGNLDLTYSVNGETIEGSTYTFTYGSYTDVATSETFTVTVSYVANGNEQSITYTYTLVMKDTTAYRLVNGGFENGMEGWTAVGNIGAVSTEKSYWAGDFGMDGEKMFSAYAPGIEEKAVGMLTSSTFKVGGSGFVTFKIGALRDGNYCYIDVVDATTKQILARYYNGLWERDKSHCTLIEYKADLSAFMGKEVFFRISDNADSDYGLFFADSFITYYENEPEGNPATSVGYAISGTVHDVFNGSFEINGLAGWWSIGEIGVVTNATHYWDGFPEQSYDKNGEHLFTGVGSAGADTHREGNTGTLTSSVFEIGGTGWISFKLGGGANALCYVQVIDALTGEVLARYHQQAQRDGALIQYVADLSAYIGRVVRFQVVDYASANWGCVSFDNLITYYPVASAYPEGITAIDISAEIKYSIVNGSFESGNLHGWTMHITQEGAFNTLGWVLKEEINRDWYGNHGSNADRKDGDFLFTFVTPNDENCETNKGTLTSSTFTLKKDSYVSFRFGGAGGGENHDVYIILCRADGSVIAKFYNDAPDKLNVLMNAYYYQYTGEETECYFQVVDNSTSGYGCFVVDDFRVNLESAPEGFIKAIEAQE